MISCMEGMKRLGLICFLAHKSQGLTVLRSLHQATCFHRTLTLPSTTAIPVLRNTQEADSTSALSELSAANSKQDTLLSAYTNNGSMKSSSKVSYLRDLMWIREALEDLTAAEFAINLDQTIDTSKRRKRAVDFENLLTKLNSRMMDMGCEPNTEDCELDQSTGLPVNNTVSNLVYSDEQRRDLFNRILETRYLLMETMKNKGGDVAEDPFSISLPKINVEISKGANTDGSGPKLYVRDDGTVDWDGALQDKTAIKNFGTAVWARINGRDPVELSDETEIDGQNSDGRKDDRKQVTAKIDETDSIRKEKEKLNELEGSLKNMEKENDVLLNSAISAGQAVANIKLATLKPEFRRKINTAKAALEQKREEVVYQRLIYELERIFTYLSAELNNSSGKGYIPLQDRLNIAEFGLLESQIGSFRDQIEVGELLDGDVLAVVSEQVTDFKRRLGIDYYVAGLTFDKEAITTFGNELIEKTKSGLAFYVKGCRLLWSDLAYAGSLIIRAAGGYTLKPREVRNLRRTFKDTITFIPVVIILLIPLSPVGHVLVFGAIQRVFPDFFPSCFREDRQNLLQLYESAEYSELTINENIREKFVRILEAIFFQIANSATKLLSPLSGEKNNEDSSQEL
mmetsp:Transcript_15503/g.17883  ORF Transcript_15503/g.17883 Transcript_15503/m.17883 type:complete len:627 (+) Transcript_15503:206-2086(+)